jgi:hypothetical protein
MHYLRFLCESLSIYGSRVLLLSAAAVSDFYIPWNEMSEHKLQSRDFKVEKKTSFPLSPPASPPAAALHLQLKAVPKILGMVKEKWAPNMCLFSFKLETDSSLLVSKACAAIRAYRVDGVIANELYSRYTDVSIIHTFRSFKLEGESERANEKEVPELDEMPGLSVIRIHRDLIGHDKAKGSSEASAVDEEEGSSLSRMADEFTEPLEEELVDAVIMLHARYIKAGRESSS